MHPNSNTPPPPCTTIDSPQGPQASADKPQTTQAAGGYSDQIPVTISYQTSVESWLCVVRVASRLPQFSAATHRQDRNGTRWPRSLDQSLELKRLRALESQTDVGAAVQRQRPPQQPGYTHTPGLSVGGAERGR
ncbi:hypothetical protein CEP54_013598 [Fusarium duplospermum]|uniref:Uncharacterized protein n=1 Tax=Fusarium duplospermum TaxID=1325734 RepID=A0A428P1V6_9HYPO|nr:hypothetical protein CEP54_013598 [Fusarium duplospermum]